LSFYLYKMDYSQLLNYISQYVSLTEEEQTIVQSKFKLRKYLKNQFLVQNGDVCQFESFVVSGCLKTFYIDDSGQEHVMSFAIENWWTADLGSFITQAPAIFHIDALEDTEVLQIEKNDLETLYREAPRFERFFRIIIQYHYVASQYRIVQNLAFTAEERYMYFREKYPGLELRIPQKQVAAFLGITPEFLSSLRKKMRDHES